MSKKNNQSLNIVLLISLCVAITVIVVLSIALLTKNDSSTNVSGETNQTISDLADNSEEPLKTFNIETPYCTLKYPEKWKQYLKYTESTENGVYTQTYYCVLNDNEIEMFSIYFGEVENSTVIGNIMYEDTAMPFSVTSKNSNASESFTDEERAILSGMDYSINTIIESVIASPNYVG